MAEIAFTKAGKKVSDTYHEENGIIFGISAKSVADALDAIDYFKDLQAENYSKKNADAAEMCHKNIVEISEYLKRNGYV